MGQYYLAANLERSEKLHPHDLGDGAKLMEFGSSGLGTMAALASLLTASDERISAWAGQRVVIAGDYADEGRFLPPSSSGETLYSVAREGFACAKEMAQKAADSLGVPIDGGDYWDRPSALSQLPDNHIFEQPEELFEVMGSIVVEDLRATLSDCLRTLRMSSDCRNNPLGWWSVDKVDVTLEKNAVTLLSVLYSDRQGIKSSRTLEFPASVQSVREFFAIKPKSAEKA